MVVRVFHQSGGVSWKTSLEHLSLYQAPLYPFVPILFRMVGKKIERLRRFVIVTHEHQRGLRTKQKKTLQHIEKFGRDQGAQTFTTQPVSSLIVVVEEIHECLRRQVVTPLTALFEVLRRA